MKKGAKKGGRWPVEILLQVNPIFLGPIKAWANKKKNKKFNFSWSRFGHVRRQGVAEGMNEEKGKTGVKGVTQIFPQVNTVFLWPIWSHANKKRLKSWSEIGHALVTLAVKA